MNLPQQLHVRIAGLHKSFDAAHERIHVLNDINLDVARGEFVSLLGPSGCGKSTLLRLIGGLIGSDSGDIRIDDQTPDQAQAERSLGFVFQEPSLLPWRTVAANVRLPFDVNRQEGNVNRNEVDNLLRVVGLDSFSDYYPHQLSGGMQQRTALARALAVGGSLLLMDEPFGALDEITRASMRYELLRIWEADRKTVVFVTHSIAEAVALSDRVVVLSSLPGRIVSIVDVDLPRPRTSDLEREPGFLQYRSMLQDLLARDSLTLRATGG